MTLLHALHVDRPIRKAEDCKQRIRGMEKPSSSETDNFWTMRNSRSIKSALAFGPRVLIVLIDIRPGPSKTRSTRLFGYKRLSSTGTNRHLQQ